MRKYIVIILCAVLFSSNASDFDVAGMLSLQRPRIIANQNTFDELREQARTDTLLQRYITQVISQANEVLNYSLPQYFVDEGGRMLDVSRDCLDRILTLGVAYKMTHDKAYLSCAQDILLEVSRFRDWNFYHFLDVAEMATAVSVGYDWFYDDLSEQEREEIRLALIRNALVPGLAVYGSSPWQYWLDVDHNWNQVCNGGMAIASLAIADTDPVYANKILPPVVENLPKAMNSYAPDGAWGEGVSYWFYATRYTAYCLGTMQASLGTDFNLADAQGFDTTGYFPIHMTTPSGGYFSYADIDPNKRAKPIPVMFWLANRFNNHDFSAYEHDLLTHFPATALDVLYYMPPQEVAETSSCDALFGGVGSFAIMRESWENDNCIYVAISGGDNRMNHGHLDKGSFELECDGVKWVRDLGSDNYNLPGYWEKEEDGERWQYFRLNTFGHSTVVVNNDNQKVNAYTRYEKMGQDSEGSTFAVLDMSEAYSHNLREIKRGFKLLRKSRALLVQDEYICSDKTPNITWQIITEADIKGNGRKLTLSQNNKTMHLILLTPEHRFTVKSAQQKAPQARNEGYKKICIDINSPNSKEKIAVLFATQEVDSYSDIPLKDW